MSRTRVNVAAGLAAAFLALAGALAAAAPASAHSQVVSTSPADGSTITSLPAELSVTANENLADLTGTGQGFALVLVGPDGTKQSLSPVSIDGPTVSAAPPDGLAPGLYELQYQIVSADTHPVSGSIHFTYDPNGKAVAGESRPTSQPTGVSTTVPGAGPETPVFSLPTWAFAVIAVVVVIVIAAAVWIVVAVRRRRSEH